jgi:phospholipase/carboxylesterase
LVVHLVAKTDKMISEYRQEDIAMDAVVINSKGKHKATVIWMHGLGADGNDFAPIVPLLKFGKAEHVKYIFPHAPIRPVTLNGGMPMRAWFDLDVLSKRITLDVNGIFDSVESINKLIDAEINAGITSDKIILAGFSQGASIATVTALHYPKQLAGVMCLSGLIVDDPAMVPDPEVQQKAPFFMAHGSGDQVIPIQMGLNSREVVRRWGFEVDWHQYDMAHSVCPEEIQDIAIFFDSILGQKI